MTASCQWLERTLDDSANRRLAIPEPFLALDACLDVMINVTGGLIVHGASIAANLRREMPFLATENILMAAVKNGGDRQDLHEIIRKHSQDAALAVKNEGKPNDLLERLKVEHSFDGIDLDAICNPMDFVGLAPLQVEAFFKEVVLPLRQRWTMEELRGETVLRV